VQRVFVASFGNDANTATNCNFANPCRGFTAAMTVVDPGGEVVALDAAGYGAVVITKSVTLTANPGFYAGISASSGNAVTIATAAVNVTLRGLNINSVGATNGVVMTNGAKLSIENCVISNFTGGYGVQVTNPAVVRIVDTLIRDGQTGVHLENGASAVISTSKLLGNSNRGVEVYGAPASTTTTAAINDSVVSGSFVGVNPQGLVASATARISIDRSALVNNVYGVAAEAAGGPALLTISNSLVTGNINTGLHQFGAGAVLESQGNNNVRQNSLNTSGTITPVTPI
jgi:hypothetical protein